MVTILYGFTLIALAIAIIIGCAYFFTNNETGDLLEYQKSSNYQYIKLSHGLTAYKEFGSKNDIPIIVIHGATLPSEGFLEFCESLSQHGYWVICYDQYGRGYSDRPKIKYTMEVYLFQLNELINYLNIKKFILYGASMGAPIAINYSNNNSKSVLAVGLQVPLVHINNSILKTLRIPIIGNLMMRFFGISSAKKRALHWEINSSNQRLFLSKYLKQLSLPGTEHSLLSMFRYISSKNYFSDYVNFAKFEIPIHIAYASDDEEVPPESIKQVINNIPHVESLVFTGGHGGGNKILDDLTNIFSEFLKKHLN